jgi:hypothetical protein
LTRKKPSIQPICAFGQRYRCLLDAFIELWDELGDLVLPATIVLLALVLGFEGGSPSAPVVVLVFYSLFTTTDGQPSEAVPRRRS